MRQHDAYKLLRKKMDCKKMKMSGKRSVIFELDNIIKTN